MAAKRITKLRKIEPLLGVADCHTYRDLLAQIFKVATEQFPFFNHTYFCQQAGLRSRNAVRDIISGRRNLTLNSYQRILTTLDLSPPFTKLLRLLVAQDQPDLERLPREGGAKAIARQKKLMQKEASSAAAFPERVLRDRRYLEVYAAAGSEEEGATIEQIATRCQLRVPYVQQVVRMLAEIDLVRIIEDRILPANPHVVVEKLGGHEYFRGSFMQTLEEVMKDQVQLFSRSDTLFFQSVYLIRRRDQEELVARLRRTIAQFVDETMDDLGDGVAKLVLGFYT